MPNPHYVCAHSSRQPETVGAVTSEPKTIQKAAALGAVYLPIEPELIKQLPLGGFVRRSWGQGWPFELNRAEGGSPLAIQVRAGDSRLHWAAEVCAPSTFGSRPLFRGKLQLALIRSAVGSLSPGYSQVAQPEPFELQSGQSLVLRGVVQLNTLIDGLVALHLWGVCSNVVVRWVAVSQAGMNQ